MTVVNDDVNQANKQLVFSFWQDLDDDARAGGKNAAAIVAAAMADDVNWHGYAPLGSLAGIDDFIGSFWQPLLHSFPDLTRETHLFFGGQSNGRVDGDMTLDGHQWVTGTGYFHATFTNDYLGIPATGERVRLRWGDFSRVADGKIAEVYFLIDMIDLLQQAGQSVLPPSRGADGIYPPPAAADGVLLGAVDATTTAYSLDHIRRFIFDGLNAFDEEDLSSMGMADFFDPEVQWYGPGGIGACLSLKEFEDLHQQPWLIAYPDRQVQDLTALFAEGNYSGGPGWAGVKATHTGPYLDCPATGNSVEFNGLDWWKRDGELYIENWVFVDMIHLFDQFGVDLMARVR